MPHISVKMIKGRTVEQKQKLAKDLEKALCESLGCSSSWVTVSIEDYTGQEWQEVFEKEITQNKEHIFKDAEYDPKTLL